MAQIVINEISQNYTYNIGTSSFATVALPITACWGPGYFDPYTYYGDSMSDCEDPHEVMLEHTVWQRFPANQQGLESFVSTYRGPSSVYRRAKDYSYQMAVTLLTAGYDVLVCRLCPGSIAASSFKQQKRNDDGTLVENTDKDAPIITFRAKYPGTFGNNIQVTIKKNSYFDTTDRVKKLYWNVITHVIDASGIKTSVENIPLVFDEENSSDTIPYYKDAESNFWTVSLSGVVDEGTPGDAESINAVGVPYPVMYYTSNKAYDYSTGGYIDVTIGDEVPLGKCPSGINVLLENIHYNRLKGGDDIQAPFKDDQGEVIARPYPQTEEPDYGQPRSYAMTTFERVMKARYAWATLYNTAEEPTNYTKYPNVLDTDITITKLDASGNPIIDANTGEAETEVVKFIDTFDKDDLEILFYKEWLYTHLVGRQVQDDTDTSPSSIAYEGVFDLLKDKLAYNPNRVIASGWDDQDLSQYIPDFPMLSRYMTNGSLDPVEDTEDCPDTCLLPVSPLHLKLMDVAYYGRCATALIDIPRIVDRKFVHIEDEYNMDREGYTQKLARVVPYNASMDVNGSLFHTHSALFAPWGQYQYVGTAKMATASPAFLALLIQRSQILNQPDQYEWALPRNRKHNIRIGRLDYTVPKKLLDRWQKLEGASLNIITNIPDLGTNIWGNSTLFEVPPATYQALANLSTRYLVNAVENVVYRCGIGITFQYNNEQAYNRFYAGVTPILDTMKNVGAIEDYYVRMSADINGLDQVNANTVIGKIYLVVNGVINDIYVDLIALPPGVDLSTVR